MKFWPQLKEHPPLLPDLQAQLAKDLDLENTAVPAKDLITWLDKYLQDFIAQGGNLAQLLYRIDLDQTGIRHNTKELALQILERQAQKVIFRAQYSGKL